MDRKFFKISINDDISVMYKPTGQLLEVEMLYSKLVNSNNVVLIFTTDKDNDFQKHLEMEEVLLYKIYSKNLDIKFEAFSKYLPSINTQKENIALVQQLYAHHLDSYANFLSNNDKRTLEAELLKNNVLNYKKGEFELLNSFVLANNKTLIILKNPKNIDFLKTESGVEIVNIKNILSSIISDYSKRCYFLILPIFILIFLILAITFSPRKAILLIIPSFLGGVLALCLPALWGMQLTFFHIVSVFLVIGFGIDYSVFRQSTSLWARDAIALSAMTTIFSFALLMFVDFYLIKSLGTVVTVGLAFSYLFSLVFVQGGANEKVV